MLKKILLRALNKFLGNYVENIDKHQFELGIFKGYVSVSNLRIKSSVISRLFEGRVVSNSIGTLRVLVPWKSFSRKPIEIYVKDVDIKLGKAGFCWCFLDEKLCTECVEYEKYEFMTKLDKLSVLSDAREDNSTLFKDLIAGDGFRVLIENVNVEYVSGASIALRVQKVEFNKKTKGEVKNMKIFDAVGIEVVGASKVLGPFDIYSKIKMLPKDINPRIEVSLNDFHVEVKQQIAEEILRGAREYAEDRVRWTLFRSYLEYREILRTAREMNLWKDQEDPASSDRSVAMEIWKRLIRLQKKAMESKGVVLEEIPGIISKIKEYREILGRSGLSFKEVERKKRCEREICLERLLKVKRSLSEVSEKKSWKNILSFMKEEANNKRTSMIIPATFSVGEATVVIIDEKHQGFKIVVPKTRVGVKDLLSPSRLDFKGDKWRLYFIDARLNERDPHSELISLLLDVRGTLIQDGAGLYVKGIAKEWKVLGYRRELPHCFEGFMRLVKRSYVPSYGLAAPRGKTRADFKVDIVSMESDLERFVKIEPSSRYGIECAGMVLSYVNDEINTKRAASLTISSSFVYRVNSVSKEREALSNKIETTVLLVDNVFYVKTSMVDLYAHGVYPNDFRGNGVVFPVGFVVPNFEVCSDAIRINGPDGRAELQRIKMSGNGGSIFDMEIFKGKVLDSNGKTMCRIPRMKIEARIGRALLLDVVYLKICGRARRIARLARGMTWMANGEVSTKVIARIKRIEGDIRCKGSILRIIVDEYFQGLAKSVRAVLNESIINIENFEAGEEFGWKSAVLTIRKEDLKNLDGFGRIFKKIGSRSSAFKASAGGLVIKLLNGGEIEIESLRIFRDEGGMIIYPFEVKVFNTGDSSTSADSRKREVEMCISKIEISDTKATIEGSIKGEINEETLIKIKDGIKEIPIPSGGSLETVVLLDISLSMVISGNPLKIACPLTLWQKADEYEITLQQIEIASGDGQNTNLFEVHAKGADGVLRLSVSKMEIHIEPFRLASILYPLVHGTGDTDFVKKVEVDIEEIFAKTKSIDGIRMRNVRYRDELLLQFSVLDEPGSKVAYKRVNGSESYLLSVIGGSYELSSLAALVSFCSSEYMQIYSKFGIQVSRARLHVLCMDLKVLLGDALFALRINLPIVYFDMEDLNSFKGRALCSLDVYDSNSMEFIPFIEENVLLARKYGTFLDVRTLTKLRILYLDEITSTIWSLFASEETGITMFGKPFRNKVSIRNITDTVLWVKTKRYAGRVGKGQFHEFDVDYDEHRIQIGKDEACALVYIVNSCSTSFVSEGKSFVIEVTYDGKLRGITITHVLSFLNLCDIELMGKMDYLDGSALELHMLPEFHHTIPQEKDFFLEIGMHGKYVSAGKINVSSAPKDATSTFGMICKLGLVEIGIDTVVRNAGSVSCVVIILYPIFEVMNRTASVLNLILSVGKDNTPGGESETQKKNIPLSVDRDCKEDIYGISFSELPLLYVQSLGSRATARAFENKASIEINSHYSGEIRKEQAEIISFFGRHTLAHRIRMVIYSPMVIINHLGNDIWINGARFGPGPSCSNRLKDIHSLAVGEYSIEESVEVGKKFTKAFILKKRGFKGHKTWKSHEGQEWSNEAIFGGFGPKTGIQPSCIRLLLEFGEDQGRRIIECKYTYLIRNQSQMRLLAVSEHVCYYVEPHEEVPLNTSTNGFYLFIADSVNIRSPRLSGVFIPLDIKIRKYFKLQGSDAILFSVSKVTDSGQHVFGIRTEKYWPYTIHNGIDVGLRFSQKYDTIEHYVEKGSVYRYAPDSLMLDPEILLCIEDQIIQVNLNEDQVLLVHGITVSISQGSTTRVVRVSRGEISSSECRICLGIVIDSLSISLVNKEGNEVLCSHIEGLEIGAECISREAGIPELMAHPKYVEFVIQGTAESIQVDNQSLFCAFPVVFHPLDKYLRIETERRNRKKLLVFDFTFGSSAQNVSVSNLYFKTEAFALNIEENLAKSIREMFLRKKEREVKSYEKNLRIQNLKMERMGAKVNFLKDIESGFVSNVVGLFINNISDFSLEIDGMKETCLYTTFQELEDLLASFYLSQLQKNLYKVLTHLDFMGNIGSFTESVSIGIKDLLTEPSLNSNVACGIFKGGKSFLKNTIYGVSNTVGKFSKSIGTSAKFIGCSADPKHEKFRHSYARDMHLLIPRARHSKGPMTSILKGTGNLFDSITRGMVGIATSPVEGASNGVAGVVKGLGKGVLGAFAGPIAEVADLVTNISDTIKTSMNGRVKRIQYPRPAGFLGWYDEGLSQGFYIFMSMAGKVHEEERFVDGTFGDFNGRCQLVLTTRRLLISDTTTILDVCLGSIVVEGDDRKLKIGEFIMSIERPSFVASVKSIIERC
ncbi:vacuolar protein sorting-associated protein [Encephalitozoon intestinalis ATCC 50506]|uniref:Vacuolar protein sorting-associated protein n=1 Tax=Encephalitozoon intestinalis (strain ATCC 50506) TaxID=876142 RepID=E0S6L8_ENCIT|nr:vacuolar protein sorting-associated protein [Encephalitozoon intestinalis ATCC 50506]ADM11353.2 vacuolar protein sorting-associated protein [Encephalitozoon intestinalis ATCC 50506]UTX45042.1 vacuolar protein sorting-associated protein 13 [Encephalitozoon intestinalis]